MAQRTLPRVIIVGAGPNGLLLACLLRDQNVRVFILEKRSDYTRKRLVKLSNDLFSFERMVDSIHLFSQQFIEEKQRAVHSMKKDLHDKIKNWLGRCTPINVIQRELTDYYKSSGAKILVGNEFDINRQLTFLQTLSNTFIIDCTGYHSVLREQIQTGNLLSVVLEHVLVCTFTLNDRYECNELCKYYKNRHTKKYQVIPSIDDTYILDGRQTHVTGLITIDEELFRQMPKTEKITLEYLRKSQTEIYDDLMIFLRNLSHDDLSRIRFETMDFVALPLNEYRAKKLTHSTTNQHWVLMGDSAMGGPYFQSISMGFESAIYFAHIFTQMRDPLQMLSKYEAYLDTLWLKLQIHSKEVHKNKEIFQALIKEGPDAVLRLLKIY